MLLRAQLPVGALPPRSCAGAPACVPRARPLVASGRLIPQQSQQRLAPIARASSPLAPLTYVEGYKEVEKIAGARLIADGDKPRIEYLTKWKDGSEDTWEAAADLSEDLVRDYEEKWWAAARKADVDTMIDMLAGGRELLALAVDENRRSALHFAAALGSADCTRLMVEAGAELDLQDREGYTPLHMAAGYMHTPSMAVLLEAGANPEIKDSQGRDVVSLIDNLRNSMPLNMATVQRRLALEEVANCLTDRLYDEVPPSNILNSRPSPDGASREFLVSFADGRDDEWVPERNVAPDLLEDYLAGLEYAEAEEVLDVVQVRTERRFKVKWSDGYPTSWEPEEHVPPELIAVFAQKNPDLFTQRTSAEASSSAAAAGGWEQLGISEGAGDEYVTQASPVAYAKGPGAGAGPSGAGGSGIGNGNGVGTREPVGAAR